MKPQVSSFYRSIRADITAQDDIPGKISGTAIIFNRYSVPIWDWCAPGDGQFTEVITPDALRDCNLNDVRLLVNHNENMIPLARTRAGGKDLAKLDISIDETGLHFSTILDIENSPTAKDLYSAVRNETMRGMSFAFTIPEDGDSWSVTDSETIHTVRKIDMVTEISVVSMPAYPDTSVSARFARSLENDKAALERAIKSRQTLEIERLRLKIKSY